MIEHAIGTAKGHIKKQLDMITHDDPQLMGLCGIRPSWSHSHQAVW
jgi:hypothetical protein